MNENKTHILFSVAGMSPAVITETLFGLWKSGAANGGEIHILTTARGKRDMQPLLEEDGQVAAFNRAYGTSWTIRYEWVEAITATPRRATAGMPLGSGPVPLEDLRTTAHNEAAADRIVQRIREWTERDDVVLHASVAGGRKTMGMFLSQAMSWFARPGDDLSHVLVPQAFENKTFFFPEPDNPDHVDVVDFALLPFVRMRGLMPKLLAPEAGYSELVELSQVYLDDSVDGRGRLELDLTHRTLRIEGYTIELQPLSAGLFLFLFEHANAARGQPPFFFKEAFAFRDRLKEALERAGTEGLSHREKGLSALAHCMEEEWPEPWGAEGPTALAEQRKKELNDSFGKLSLDFKERLWPKATFGVHKADGRGGSEGASRWVDIPPERLRVID